MRKSAMEMKLYKIPIEEYDYVMNTKFSKGKKKEIFDLFTNSNHLCCKGEFEEIKNDLHIACIKCDLDLIKICLNKTIKDNSNSFEFKIDETNLTASLFRINNYKQEVIIPRTVEHESVEYLITSIIGTGKDFYKLKFVKNSAVKTIYSHAFSFGTRIKEINFPASLKELKEGWCCYIQKKTKITISPLNNQFIMKNNRYLLGKSDSNKDEFDILLFANRDIEEISIPSNIKIISSFAFCQCESLNKVEITPNSNLQTIGDSAFSYTNIEEIFIPSTVSIIGEYAFYCCEKLAKVEFSQNSNLQTIDKSSFSFSNINEIFIPSNVSKICEEAFSCCENLTKIEIPPNSKLQEIERSAFFKTNIKEIYFPTSLKEIKDVWFYFAGNLTKIIISPLNGHFIFKNSKYLLGKTDESKEEFDILLFTRRDIIEISIPSEIKIISSFAFYECNKLHKVEIPPNSNLQTIEKYAFSSSNIKEIFIPSTVSKICEKAFYRCNNLIKVQFSINSNLQTIESNVFSYSNIKGMFIPSKISIISKDAFTDCGNLQIIEIAEKSKLELSQLSIFLKFPNLIIMMPSSNN